MSLILEALRKSEAERRRGQAPDLRAELPPAPVRPRVVVPRWAWLLLAGAVLAFAFWRMRTPEFPRTATIVSAVEAGAAINHHAGTATTLPAVPRLIPPVVAIRPVLAPALPIERAQTASVADTEPQPDVAAANPVVVDTAPAAAAPVATGGGNILQLSDLSAAERKSLPPLKLSMHLWNDDRAKRFVILDGNRLAEGDRIGDAVVSAITADGVLLDWNGRRLKLPIR